eukprot:11185675-Lingulodinium_polyedra.AAC.1
MPPWGGWWARRCWRRGRGQQAPTCEELTAFENRPEDAMDRHGQSGRAAVRAAAMRTNEGD